METSKVLTVTGVICLFIAGLLVGLGVSSDRSVKEIKRLTDQHVQQIQDSIKVKELEITRLQNEIVRIDSLTKIAEARIQELSKSITDDNAETQIKRHEAEKFTNTEKLNWVLDRYKPKP